MPRTALTVQEPTTAFVTASFQAADQANGNSIAYTGGGLLLNVKNTNGATRTLTLTTTNVRDGFLLTSPTYIIPLTSGDKVICLTSAEVSALLNGTTLQLDWTADTGVTIAVYKTR